MTSWLRRLWCGFAHGSLAATGRFDPSTGIGRWRCRACGRTWETREAPAFEPDPLVGTPLAVRVGNLIDAARLQ